MKIIVTGGGTAGHVTPLLAVVSEISSLDPKSRVRYIGQFGDSFAKKLIGSEPFVEKQYSILAGKLRRFHGRGLGWYLSHPSLILRNIRDFFYVFIGTFQSIIILLFWRPNVVFVKGGYVGLPVGLAAGLLRIPIVTHDSDAIPGLTNRVISRFANLMAVAMPAKAYKNFYNINKVVETGVPVREDFMEISIVPKNTVKKKLGYSKESKIVAVVGGSLGAVRLNDAFMSVIHSLLKNKDVYVVWATGNGQYNELKKQIKLMGFPTKKVVIKPFFDNIPEIFQSADVVVSRAGATTMAELAVTSTPTILVPNPVLTGGHQVVNANIFVKANACAVITEAELENNPRQLLDVLEDLLSSTRTRLELGSNINKFAHENSAKSLAKLILGLG